MKTSSTAMPTKSKSIADNFGINAPKSAMIEGDFGPGSNVEIDSLYVWRPMLVKKMMMWWSGRVNQRLYLFGPTGAGKSTVVEQFGAVMGVPVFRIGVHNRLEFNETLGNVQLVSYAPAEVKQVEETKGMLGMLSRMVAAISKLSDSAVSTKFVHAELGQALVSSKNSKVIVLIDEVDQGHPSQNMAWNKLLDNCPLTLPTGEVISANNIWIAATGNTGFEDERGLYRGVQRQNIAFKSRFGMHLEIGYAEAEVEEKILEKSTPEIDENMRKTMVKFANDMRKLFVSCDLDVPLGTRTLINWARMSVCCNGMPGISPFKEALQDTFIGQCSSEDQLKISSAWQRISGT